MDPFLKLLAVITSGMFAGAAFYISAVEHPARLVAGASMALLQFRPSYKRAAPIQVSLASICFVACLALWLRTHEWVWLTGGALVAVVIPYTVAFMLSGNRALLAVNSQLDDATATLLLNKWGRLHMARTLLSLVGFVVIVLQCIRG